ncbi:MAG: arsenic resistance N-acetyltransferase ArsN2 [Gammaproteobacteria bacterium]|nr:arsenic resistance N-acetyltransferase ArsN2 [Gammaproteobacteria bacterium]
MKMNVETIQLNAEVESLLVTAELPTADLREAHNLHLFGVRGDEQLIGIIGVEVYSSAGLLRSLVVATAHRNGGYGRALVSCAEEWASQHGVKELYLLTTTASPFFKRLGYRIVQRSVAPSAIADTSQFAALCPSSATFMLKPLIAIKALRSTQKSRVPEL